MSSLCWPSAAQKNIEKGTVLKIRYPLVFVGLWFINILIVFFGLPFLIFQGLKRIR